MSKQTDNIGLTKQAENEFYNVDLVNDNLDKIDAAITKNTDKRHEHSNKGIIDKINQVLLDNWSVAYTHISDTIKHVTVAERSLWNTISNKVDREADKGLSSNDYTVADKSKLTGIEASANNYIHPSAHPASMIKYDDNKGIGGTDLQTVVDLVADKVMNQLLERSKLSNNLTTTVGGFALDARMGKTLQDQIDSVNNNFALDWSSIIGANSFPSAMQAIINRFYPPPIYLYDIGDECLSITGGWTETSYSWGGWPMQGQLIKNDGSMTITSTGYKCIGTANMLDLSKYATLRFVLSTTGVSQFGTCSNKNAGNSQMEAIRLMEASTSAVFNIDITTVKNAYVFITAEVGGSITIDSVSLWQ